MALRLAATILPQRFAVAAGGLSRVSSVSFVTSARKYIGEEPVNRVPVLQSKPGVCKDISGRWYNELGSHVDFEVDADGRLSGKYWTKVEVDPGDAGFKPTDLIGFYLLSTSNAKGATFGFTVSWEDGESTTAWTGECFKHKDGAAMLKTNWILQSEAGKLKNWWECCRIGQDVFTRQKQT